MGFQAHLELCGRCRGEAGLCTCGSPGQVTGGEGPVCLSLSTPGFRGSGCTLSPGLLSRASLPFGLMDAPMLIARRSPVLSSCCRLLLLRCLGSSRCHATVKGTAPVGPLFVHHPCRPSPLAPSPAADGNGRDWSCSLGQFSLNSACYTFSEDLYVSNFEQKPRWDESDP